MDNNMLMNCLCIPLIKKIIDAPLLYIQSGIGSSAKLGWKMGRKDLEKGALKITKRILVTYLISFIALSGVGLGFLFNPWAVKDTEAAWFNDNWGYRKEVPVTANTGVDTNSYISFTLDTAALITAGQLQSACQDLRITDVGGNVLKYRVGRTNACNLTNTTIDALVPTLGAGASTFYVYYGNPSVGSAANSSNFTEAEAVTYTIGTIGSEQKSPSPVAYWKFDDAQGTNAEDSTTNRLDGTLGGIVPGGSNGSPTKINDAANFGALNYDARQVVRTTTGTLYAVVNRAGSCEVWKSTNGTSWTEQDSVNNPTCTSGASIAVAIDSSNVLHIAYILTTSAKYISFNTSADTFGTVENVYTQSTGVGPSIDNVSIAVDSSNKPHIYLLASTGSIWQGKYTNRIAGSWKTTVNCCGASDLGNYAFDMVINSDNIPVLMEITGSGSTLTANIGNTNDAASFTLHTIDSATAASYGSIAVDSSGNIWIAYIDENGVSDYVTLVKHNYGDAWATWQTPITNSNIGIKPSITINGTDVYVFYEDAADDIAYLKYTGAWTGPTVLQTGIFQDVKAKWSYYNNNQGSLQIDYLYSDATDVYWASLALGTASSTPDWKSEDLCISAKCLYFDGTNADTVVKSDDAKLDFGAADSFSIGAWVKRNGTVSAASYIITKADSTTGGYKLYMDDSGDLCFGIDDDSIWGPDVSSCTIGVDFDDDNWHYVVGVRNVSTDKTYLYVDGNERDNDTDPTTTTLANTGAFIAGVDSDGTSGKWKGFIDEVKVYNFALTDAQVKANYNARGNPEGVASVLGANTQNMPAALSNGLVGYWKMDETSSTAADSSGNGLTLTNNAITTYAAGKFANAGNFVAASSQYLNTATTISGVKTVAFWTNPSASSDEYLNLIASTAYITSSSGTVSATGFTSPTIYVNGVINGTITASSWNHVVVTTDTGINATAFEIGRGNGTYHNGKIDETRVYNRALSSAEVSQLYNWAPGPVGYWKLDEKTGTSGFDASGYANNGALGATTALPTWTNGKYGNALNFDGTDTFFVADSPSLSITGSFSLSGWIKPPNVSGFKPIVTKEGGGQTGYFLYLNGANVYTGFGNSGFYSQTTSTSPIAVNVWTHVASTWDNTTLRTYVNGVLIQSSTHGAVPADNSDNLGIAAAYDLSSVANAIIDDVKVYNYPRTAGQIVEDMNAGHPAPGSPVGSALAHWKFDEGYGTSLNNSGSQGATNVGTLTTFASPATTSSGWTTAGKFGKALIFDGASDTVSIAGESTFDFERTNPFTISAWINMTTGANQAFFSKYDSATGTGYALDTDGSGYLHFLLGNGSNNKIQKVCTNIYMPNGGWIYVAVSYDGSSLASGVKMFKNGVEYSCTTQNDNLSATTLNAITPYLGSINNTSNFFGAGSSGAYMDEVKVYNQALTAEQIKLDMNRGSAEVMGALSDNSSYQKQAANQEYCVPGDATACTAPVGRWDFEEGTSTTANDSSGNANTGTLTNGPVWSKGKVGKSVNLDGSDDYITLGSGATLDNITVKTLEAWVYPESLGESNLGKIFSKVGTGWWQLQMNSQPAINFHHSFSGTDGSWSIANNTVPLNTWTHIAVIYDRSSTANVPSIYINGVAQTIVVDTTPTGTADDEASASLLVGSKSDTTESFDGSVDQVRVFNYARSAAQVAWDYNRGGPVGYWKMDECQGTTINDSSGNSNTGTLTIGATGTYTTPGTCTVSSASSAWYNGAIGKRNYSIALDGTDDIITVSGLANAFFTDSWTQSLWLKTTQGGNNILTEKGSNNALVQTFNGQIRAGTVSGALYFFDTTGSPLVNDGSWHHVTVTYNGTTNLLTSYIDGVNRGSFTTSNDAASSATAYSIGARVGPSVLFSGQLDDVRVYKYDLTPTQVRNLYGEAAVRYGPATGAP